MCADYLLICVISFSSCPRWSLQAIVWKKEEKRELIFLPSVKTLLFLKCIKLELEALVNRERTIKKTISREIALLESWGYSDRHRTAEQFRSSDFRRLLEGQKWWLEFLLQLCSTRPLESRDEVSNLFDSCGVGNEEE